MEKANLKTKKYITALFGQSPTADQKAKIKVHAHAEGTPASPSPERPSRHGCLWVLHQDDRERVRGKAVQEV